MVLQNVCDLNDHLVLLLKKSDVELLQLHIELVDRLRRVLNLGDLSQVSLKVY